MISRFRRVTFIWVVDHTEEAETAAMHIFSRHPKTGFGVELISTTDGKIAFYGSPLGIELPEQDVKRLRDVLSGWLHMQGVKRGEDGERKDAPLKPVR